MRQDAKSHAGFASSTELPATSRASSMSALCQRAVKKAARPALRGTLFGIFRGALLSAIILFLLLPVTCVLVLSFGEGQRLNFPPTHWGLGLYDAFFHSAYWLDAVLTSLKIAALSSILALGVAGLAAWAISRLDVPFGNALQMLGLAPLILPAISYAVGIYFVYIDLRLLNTSIGLILVDAVLALPFVFLILGPALNRVPRELELVAMSLGASRKRAASGITLRLLLPAIGASFVYAFVSSFDESVFVQFLGGSAQNTLPKAIFDSLRTGMEPLILAISSLLVAGTGLMVVFAGFLNRILDRSVVDK